MHRLLALEQRQIARSAGFVPSYVVTRQTRRPSVPSYRFTRYHASSIQLFSTICCPALPHRTLPYPTTPLTNRTMSTNGEIPEIILRTRAAASGVTGESVEPRQILQDEERAPDPSKSIPLPPNRQRLVDDVMALYACEPTIERVCRYAPGM